MRKVFSAFKMIVIVLLGLFTMTGMIGCSSGGFYDSQPTSSSSTTTPTPSLTPDHIDLLVSSPNLDSDGKTPVTMTALVKDGNNVAIAGKVVSFAATSGVITVVNDTTDASGRATAMLGPGSDKSNRTITVTATSGAKTVENTVNVIGTVFQITGGNALALNSKTTLTIYLKDSSGGGISGKTVTLLSAQRNTFNNSAVTTDGTGKATVEVTAAVAGADTITASVTSLNVTGTFSLNVSSTRFTFTAPSSQQEVNIGAAGTPVTVRYLKTGVGPAGVRVDFTATRGTLDPAFALTDANGDATVRISSNTIAGPAVITASVAGDTSIQQPIEFVATTADLMTLQANPTTIGPNLTVPATEASAVTAVVFDLTRNRVKNKIIDFELTDSTLGSISPLSAQTDSLGQASTVFTPGPATSGLDGVSIKATVRDRPSVIMIVRLTVANKALFISLGANNKITNPVNTPQAYQFDYVVIVSDAAGHPVANATVYLNVV
ncbi:MAG: Ig-like domain-containing protein, partial [Deltaproteobacteria bacterium]|nr:Ig-like domain-containing protein [Deltaproteobacteria bacterium]